MHDPIAQFTAWLEDATAHPQIAEPTAMCLATVDAATGQPSARIVLLKGVSAEGFVFYTNMESRKSEELTAHPKAALCFYWMPLLRQVRIEGVAQRIDDAQADAYFASRPRESRIGAWASRQSRALESMKALQQAVADTARRFEGQEIPRPPFWSGWRIAPESIEFWQQGDFRLHERQRFRRSGGDWRMERLYP